MAKKPPVLDIPELAREPKPNYPTEELAKAAKQPFLDHVRSGKRPYEWEGITYTNPKKGERIRYICDFEVPNYRRDSDTGCPCPHCSPTSPKFRSGRLAWFPDSHVLRIIGPKCFKSIDSEEHERANAEFLAEKQREIALENLRRDPNRLALVAKQMANAVAFAEALEKVRGDVRDTLTRGRMDLSTHARDGLLIVSEDVRYKTSDGREERMATPYMRDSTPLTFYRADKPIYMDKLPKALSTFAAAVRELEETDLATASTSDMKRLNSRLTGSHKAADECIAGIRVIHAGIDGGIIGRIRDWSAREDSAIGGKLVDIRREPDAIVVRAGALSRRVKIPEILWSRLEDLAAI